MGYAMIDITVRTPDNLECTLLLPYRTSIPSTALALVTPFARRFAKQSATRRTMTATDEMNLGSGYRASCFALNG